MVNKKFAIVVFTISIIYIIIAVFGFWLVGLVVKNNFERELSSTMDIAIAAVNPDRIDNMSKNPSDSDSIDYKRLKEQLLKLGEPFRLRNIDCIYALGRNNDGSIFFIVDSFEDINPRYSAPGEVYEQAPRELNDIFYSQKSYFIGPYTDEYGTFVSYFAPIKTFSDSRMVGVMGVDIDYDLYKNIILKNQLTYTLILVLLYITSLFLFLYFNKRTQVRMEIEENEIKIKNIINSIFDAIVMTDNNGIIYFWNKASEDLFNYRQSDVIGKNIKDFVSLPKNLSFDEKMVDIKKTFEFNIKKNKKTIIIELSLSKVVTQENIFIIGVFRDISERVQNDLWLRKQKEDLEKMNKLMIGRELKMIELKKILSSLNNKK